MTREELDKIEGEALAKYPPKIDATTWDGPCGDSFCFASCDSPTCRYEYRLGNTPALHNAEIDLRQANDPVLRMVAELRSRDPSLSKPVEKLVVYEFRARFVMPRGVNIRFKEFHDELEKVMVTALTKLAPTASVKECDFGPSKLRGGKP